MKNKSPGNSVFSVTNLHVSRDQAPILTKISFEVSAGECFVILGANGAGKTTLIESLMGFHRITEGEVRFCGKSILALPIESRVGLGMAWVPEGRRLFGEMTVQENIRMGLIASSKHFNTEWVFDLFPIVRQRFHQRANSLSGGEQQMVSIARALVAQPRLLLLDEVSIGLAPIVTESIFTMLPEIQKRGISVVCVEQNVELALKFAQRGIVLENGQIALQGSASDLIKSDQIRKAYLGRE